MKNIIVFLFFTSLFSCKHYPTQSKDVVGKYISMSDRGERDFLIFHIDSTYEHIYLNIDDDVKEKILGNWKLVDKGSLYVTNWKEFGLSPTASFHKPSSQIILLITNSGIYASGDDYSRNFKKMQ